jgi:hypothetical protein
LQPAAPTAERGGVWRGASETRLQRALVSCALLPTGKSGPFAEFSCGASAVSVRGAVIVPVQANKMSLTQAVKFSASKGKQKPEHFEGGAQAVLEESIGAGPYEQTGLSATITQTSKEKVEIDSVF